MKNEKGLTLIEVLATLAISSLIIGALFMVFSSFQQQWEQTTQKFTDDSQARTTLQMLTHYLTDAVRVVVQKEQNQFLAELEGGRIITFKYEEPSLFVKDSEQDLELANNVANFPTFMNDKGEEISVIDSGARLTISLDFYVHSEDDGGMKIKSMQFTVKLRKDYSTL